MKFHQLPIGARFRFRDTVYRKISPLKGDNEVDGTQRLVPRSAEVTRLADDHLTAPGLPDQLSGGAVETAAWGMIEECKHELQRIDPILTPGQHEQVLAALEAATQKMLVTLAGGQQGV